MRILLCTDGSPDAEQAAQFGLQFARGSNEPIELLGVIEERQDTEQQGRKCLQDKYPLPTAKIQNAIHA